MIPCFEPFIRAAKAVIPQIDLTEIRKKKKYEKRGK